MQTVSVCECVLYILLLLYYFLSIQLLTQVQIQGDLFFIIQHRVALQNETNVEGT